MTEEILKERGIEVYVRSWTLIPGKGGVFEFTINGTRLYSKKEMGRHAEPGEIKGLLIEHLQALIPNFTLEVE